MQTGACTREPSTGEMTQPYAGGFAAARKKGPEEGGI